MPTYPTLSALLADLETMRREGILEAIAPTRPTIGGGRDVSKVTWPGLGEFWLNGEQREVVRILLSALLETRCPDVDQRQLIQAAGSRAQQLRDVFAGSAAWGVLIVPGARGGTYRLPPLSERPEDE